MILVLGRLIALILVTILLLAFLGIFLFKESADWVRIMSISFIVIGIIGLKLSHVE